MLSPEQFLEKRAAAFCLELRKNKYLEQLIVSVKR